MGDTSVNGQRRGGSVSLPTHRRGPFPTPRHRRSASPLANSDAGSHFAACLPLPMVVCTPATFPLMAIQAGFRPPGIASISTSWIPPAGWPPPLGKTRPFQKRYRHSALGVPSPMSSGGIGIDRESHGQLHPGWACDDGWPGEEVVRAAGGGGGGCRIQPPLFQKDPAPLSSPTHHSWGFDHLGGRSRCSAKSSPPLQ